MIRLLRLRAKNMPALMSAGKPRIPTSILTRPPVEKLLSLLLANCGNIGTIDRADL
jgi:hypothetical protein